MSADNAVGTLQESLKLDITPSKIKEGLGHVINGNVESVLNTLLNMFKDGDKMKKIKHNTVRNNLTKNNNTEAFSLIVKAEELIKERRDKASISGKEVKPTGPNDEFLYYKNLLNQFYKRRTSMDTAVALATLVDYTVRQLSMHARTMAIHEDSKFLDERCMLKGVETLEVYPLIRNCPTFVALYEDFQKRSKSEDKAAFKDFGYNEGVAKEEPLPKLPLQGQCNRIIGDVAKPVKPKTDGDMTQNRKARGSFKRFVIRVVAVEMLSMLYRAINIDIVAENSKTASVKNARKVVAIIVESNNGNLTQFNTYLDNKLEDYSAWSKRKSKARDEKKGTK